ncbi:MAG TPA: hypothetical protein VF266_05600 [Thermoanaerobaculia bacterium]
MLRIAAIVVCLAIPFSAFAGNAVGKPSVGSSTIEWPNPSGQHESVELVLSFPNGDTITKTYNGNRPITLRLSDLGSDIEDGAYTWEIRVAPTVSGAVAKKLENARAANDDSAARKIMREAGLTDNVSSGTITVSGGTFVNPSATEARMQTETSSQKEEETTIGGTTTPRGGKVAVNDQVIPDDLIVQSSLCVGFDCVNGESFGFDTIRLKENSTRIKFEDTSTGSFPSNDWQLTANDPPGGTANRFSIEDITGAKVPMTITAGASTNSIFVDSTGRVGFRTATPVLDLHVSTSNTPAIRLEQTNAGGFTAQTWDIAGNEANFFVRDVTSGSRLPFRIRPGAPTSSIDISADGDVGVGTASPDTKLNIEASDDANTITLVQNTNSTGLSAAGVLQAKGDTAVTSLIAHGTGRTISRFGQTLGAWSEMLNAGGNGLIVGTQGSTPLILGTNSTARMTIASTGAITVPGNFTVSGVKNFAVVDPANENQALYYTALEGPEAGTYYRGTAKTVNGEVVIELPGYFSRLTENERMTVQLTPVGAPGQLYVASKSAEKLVIKVANGSTDLEFDYLVQGVRKGYLGYEVEREGAFPVVQK